jgi:glycosyltransferase involved in cell wall biosynthesis
LHGLDPDVVMSGGFAPANLAALRYCKRFRKPYIGFGELVLRDPFHRSPIRRALRRWVTRASAGAIASSSEARAAFLAYGAKPDRILVVPMPIDVEHFHAGSERFRGSRDWAAARRRYPGPILLTVTRLIRMKGLDELLSIYERIIAVRPDVTLLIAGDGPERGRYEEWVRRRGWRRVEFLGYIDTSVLPQTLALADLFVFPTLYDQFGAVIAEAMAAGVPVAASIHAAATHDLVEDGVTGFRIEPRAVEASAATILRMLDLNSDGRAALRARALARVRESAVEPSAERMTRFLRLIAESPAGAVLG